MANEKKAALHWLMVGYVSHGAKEWIEQNGGRVLSVNNDPPLYAVALAYHPDGAWVWSKGRQEHRHGIEYWSTGELQEASTGITLIYSNSIDTSSLAEYCDAASNYLILPDEEFDSKTGKAIKPTITEADIPAIPELDEILGSLDDHPF